MNRYTDSMQQTAFTPEEKNALAMRLRQAARQQTARPPASLTRRAVCAFGIAAAVCVASAAAAPTIIKMAQGSIPFFGSAQNSTRFGSSDKFEQFNSAVGTSRTQDGVTLTIDNIALDDSYLGIFFTVTGEQALRRTVADAPEHWIASWDAPSFTVKANGETLHTPGNLEIDARYEDERTLVGMQRLALPKLMSDTVNLVLTAPSVFGVEGEWRFALAVDSSAASAQSLSVEPMQQATLSGRKIRIDKVSISPLGNTITISETLSGDEVPAADFALRDDKGNYLPVIDSGLDGAGLGGRTVNTFSFAGGTTDIRSLTLLPVSGGDADQTVGKIGNYPIRPQAPVSGYYQIDALDVGDKQAVATVSVHGYAGSVNPELQLLDAAGQSVPFTGDVHMDRFCDPQTGVWTVSLYYPDATAEQIAQTKQVGIYQSNATPNESGAVTVPLQ